MHTVLNPDQMGHAEDIFRFLQDQIQAGSSCTLVIVTDVYGGTLRRKGALMAVSETGALCGYVSNDCVDSDIVLQAQMALKGKTPRYLRYGEGSPFKDITLPCGGAIELALIPDPDITLIDQAVSAFTKRCSFALYMDETHRLSLCDLAVAVEENAIFYAPYYPRLCLRIAGRGQAMVQLARQAQAAGFELVLQSPDSELLAGYDDVPTHHLMDLRTPPDIRDDPWSALVLLFHDHEWELSLLSQALESPCFYIGAMGSARTHDLRRTALLDQGFSAEKVASIHGPIGLIPAMRDANLLALSILAQIVSIAKDKALL